MLAARYFAESWMEELQVGNAMESKVDEGFDPDQWNGAVEFEFTGDDGETSFGTLRYTALQDGGDGEIAIDSTSLIGEVPDEALYSSSRLDDALATDSVQPGETDHEDAMEAALEDAQGDWNERDYKYSQGESIEKNKKNIVTEGHNDAWYAKEDAKEKYAKANDGKDLFKQGIDVQEKWIAKEMKARGYKKVEGRWIKESLSTVKKLIKEGQLEGAELTLAAKDMVDRVQGMLEDLGEMLNEDLAPLVDAVRDEMGTEIADQFSAAMSDSIGQALENMRATRESTDVASRILMGEAPAEMMGADEIPMEPTTDMDTEMGEMPPDEAGPPEEDFAMADAAEGGEAELGREKRA
jgi:hypothetical protein